MTQTTPRPRVVVVTFDAASRAFAICPDPVSIAPGTSTLYFALQTANRGDVPEAAFTAIYEDNLITAAEPVDGCDQLWRVEIVNVAPPTVENEIESESHPYSVRIRYNGVELTRDPTVLLEPPPIGT